MNYKVFISYRKSSPVNAEYVRTRVEDGTMYDPDEIFMDNETIGPEPFDDCLLKAVSKSSCLVILVTTDCFIPKPDGEDWFIREIKEAINRKISIIPVLFDGIISLSSSDIINDLKLSFSDDEIETIIKAQSIKYSVDYPNASMNKLNRFIVEANQKRKDWKSTIILYSKIVSVFLVLLCLVVALFFGIGVIWGYYSSSGDEERIIIDNTITDGGVIDLNFVGYHAYYDLNKDTIVLDFSEKERTNRIKKVSNIDLIATCFSWSSAKYILNRNVSRIRYLKFLKGGSKQAKIGLVCAYAVACVGVICGFSQGRDFGKIKRQEDAFFIILPKLQYKSLWRPVIERNINLILLDKEWEVMVAPSFESSLAFDMGFTSTYVVLRFNSWEIGQNNYSNLTRVIEESKEIEKTIVVYDTQDRSIKEFIFPSGIAGINFSLGKGNYGLYRNAYDGYLLWKKEH